MFANVKTEVAHLSGEERVILVCSLDSYVMEASWQSGSPKSHGSSSTGSSDIISYEGTLTARVSETAFQLDNEPRLKLLLTHWPCSSGGRGKPDR